jgi:hypothetical protein
MEKQKLSNEQIEAMREAAIEIADLGKSDSEIDSEFERSWFREINKT